jgi:hypothetical protein
VTCFTFLSFIVQVSAHCSVWFCLGILPVNILYFNQPNPAPMTLPYPSPFCAVLFDVSCTWMSVLQPSGWIQYSGSGERVGTCCLPPILGQLALLCSHIPHFGLYHARE